MNFDIVLSKRAAKALKKRGDKPGQTHGVTGRIYFEDGWKRRSSRCNKAERWVERTLPDTHRGLENYCKTGLFEQDYRSEKDWRSWGRV